MPRTARRWALIAIAAAGLVAAGLLVHDRIAEQRERSRAANNLRNMLEFAVSDAVQKGWPTAGGSRFVAALVAGANEADLSRYAGRRNDEDAYRLGSGVDQQPEVVLADVGLPGGAFLGFTDRRVVWRSKAELGLAPDDEIVVGESSKSPVLRALRR